VSRKTLDGMGRVWRRLARGVRFSAIRTIFFGAPRIADFALGDVHGHTTGDEFVERITKLLGALSLDRRLRP